MENSQYLKYKDDISKKCLYSCIAKGVGLLTLILFIFLPFLKIEADFFGQTIELKNFSIYDGLKEIRENKELELFFFEDSFFQSLIICFFVVGIVYVIYEIIVNIVRLINIENFTLEVYDLFRNGNGSELRMLNKYYDYGFSFMIIPLIPFGIFSFVAQKSIEEEAVYKGLLMEANGINWLIIVPALFLLLSIIFRYMGSRALKKVKLDILRNNYNKEK